MSITFRLACPILITPMMCLLCGGCCCSGFGACRRRYGRPSGKGFLELADHPEGPGRGGPDPAPQGEALLAVGFAHVRAADRPQRRGPAFEHAHLAHAAAAVDAADRDALAAQA